MKNEHALNAHLAKLMNRKAPGFKYVKLADKYTIGLSDFLMWYGGDSTAMEVKFVKFFPKRDDTILLAHPFKGTQLSFLREIEMTHHKAWGLIGVDDEREMHLIPNYEIPSSGNWTSSMFRQADFPCYDFSDIDGLLKGMFGDP